MTQEQSLKDNTCPKCGGPLACMTSLFVKKCGDCGAEYKWPLDKEQKNVYT